MELNATQDHSVHLDLNQEVDILAVFVTESVNGSNMPWLVIVATSGATENVLATPFLSTTNLKSVKNHGYAQDA